MCAFGRAHVDAPKGDLDGSEEITGADMPVVPNNEMFQYGTTERYPSTVDSAENILNNTAHEYLECSGKGLCNRETGDCECYDGYDGVSCQRASCPGYPNLCYGHGVCQSARQIAKNNYDNVYKLWDADTSMGCVCDPGYYGPACTYRECEHGLDPLYEDDITTAKVGIYDFAILTTGTEFSDGMADSEGTNGHWAIRFFDALGEDWLTYSIPAWARCDQVIAALEALPNHVIPTGTVECRRTEYKRSTSALDWANNFTSSGGNGQHEFWYHYRMATWTLKSDETLIQGIPNSWVVGNATHSNGILTDNAALAPSFIGDIYRVKFTANPGALREPQVELYLDGKRPSLISDGNSTIVTFASTDGQQGESEDIVADHCDGVTVSINRPNDLGFTATDWTTLGGLDADEIKLLKKCLGDADGDEDNNVEVYNWDHGSAEFPHLIKLVRIVSSFENGAYYAAIVWDSANSVFNVLNPIQPPDVLQISEVHGVQYDVFTTKGVLAQTSPSAVALFGYAQHHLITTVTSFQTTSDDETGYDGNVACESHLSGSDVPHCLLYNDKFTLLDYYHPRANPPHINLYTAKRVWTDEWQASVKDSATGVVGSNHTLHRGIHRIQTDLSLNWGATDEVFSNYSFSVYRFRPHDDSTYEYVGECSNRGVCNPETGVCDCFVGYTTGNCDTQSAVVF